MSGGDDSETQDLVGILDRLADEAEGDTVALGDLLNAFGTRAFGPMLLVPAFIALAPTGAIPGMSIVTGSLIILVAGQMLLPIEHPWFPQRLRQMEIGRERFDNSLEKARPWTKKIDRLLRPRFEFLAQPPFSYVIALVCIAMALLMFPLALLPFAVAIPAATVVLLALGLTTHDGVFIAIGLVSAGVGSFFALQMI